jgi:AraC-like DNA-binding protein
MASRIHQVTLHKTTVQGIEAMTLVSNHHFPRHSHDQFGVGVMAFGGHRSWSGVGSVTAFTGDVITVNPGEMHDGAPLTGGARGWRMIYFDPGAVAKEVEEEFVGAIEIVRPVARDVVMARLFNRLFACLTSPQSDSLAREEGLLCCLMGLLRRHGMKRPAADGRSACVAKALRRLDSALDEPVSLAELAALSGVSRFKLLRSFAREVGITPHAYLIQRRVRVARRLLASGESPAQAAVQAGFADQSHMTRTFMRQLGFTPSRYRAAVA